MMSPEYSIRPAETADLDQMATLSLALQDHLEAFNPDLWRMTPEARHNLKGQIASRLAANKGNALVAVHPDDGVVGVIFGRIVVNNRYIPTQAGLIDQLYVLPEHRRRGIARLLVAAVCRYFASHKVNDLSLRYVMSNAEASQFWTALGFEPRIVTAGAKRQNLSL
jgi:GNAT superfamily N-acetyltransferase